MIATENILGLVLAGGLSRRMGASLPKALLPFRGGSMISMVLERLGPQVGKLVINANSHQDTFAAFGHPLVADRVGGFVGPLAGLHSAMHEYPDFAWYLMSPCDSPFLPLDLVSTMTRVAEERRTRLVSAVCEQQEHPVFALVHGSLRDSLGTYLANEGRKIDRWYAQEHYALAEFPDPQAFLNFNTPEELAAWQN